MVKMMRGVIDFGTGARMRRRYGITGQIAGKTGTTNNQADGWFIGYSPQLLAGAWVGCDDRFLRFQSEALGQGAAAALPIWAYFYKKVAADKTLGIDKDAEFKQPEAFDDCDVADPTSRMRSGLNNGSIGGYSDEDESQNNSDYSPSDMDYGNEGSSDLPANNE
jgi:penicillin-binding protein 1A